MVKRSKRSTGSRRSREILKSPDQHRQNHNLRPKVAAFVAACAKSRHALGLNVAIDGLENIPPTGSFILAPDHHSFFDALLNGIMLEDGVFADSARGRREVYFAAKSEIWAIGPGDIVGRVLEPVIESLGAVAVKRDGGGTDQFLENMAYQLKNPTSEEGVVPIIYPGGTRVPSGKTTTIRRGTARVSQDTGTPIVPVGQINTEHIWKTIINPTARLDVGVKIGEPIYPGNFTEEDPEVAIRNQTAYLLGSIQGLTRQAGEMIGQ
ncbi:MAG: lysophospholipid acyltransferase family protein [Candidatus Saccharimonadales bacterium]